MAHLLRLTCPRTDDLSSPLCTDGVGVVKEVIRDDGRVTKVVVEFQTGQKKRLRPGIALRKMVVESATDLEDAAKRKSCAATAASEIKVQRQGSHQARKTRGRRKSMIQEWIENELAVARLNYEEDDGEILADGSMMRATDSDVFGASLLLLVRVQARWRGRLLRKTISIRVATRVHQMSRIAKQRAASMRATDSSRKESAIMKQTLGLLSED